MDYARSNPLRNCRYSRDLGISVFSVYICTLAYACIAPFILIFAFIYFCLMFFVWRYQQLYVYQSAYNSRGQMWSFSAHRIVACLAVMVLFSGAMFLVKSGFWQGILAIVLLEIFLIAFDRQVTTIQFP